MVYHIANTPFMLANTPEEYIEDPLQIDSPAIHEIVEQDSNVIHLPIGIDTVADFLSIFLSVIFAIFARELSKNRDSINKILRNVRHISAETKTSLLSEQYLKRIDQLLAQIAIIGGYDRVVLGIFHNGVVGMRYSKFEKFLIASSYVVSGIEEVPEMGKDLNVSDISIDLALLERFIDGAMVVDTKNVDMYGSNCFLYLKNRNIHQLNNQLLTSNDGLHLGILSKQHCSHDVTTLSEKEIETIDTLTQEVASIIEVYAKTGKVYN